jgi:DNA-binding beta-propeller fold protein YncE
VVGNYASGTVAVLPIAAYGSLEKLSDLATLTGTPGPDPVQQTSSHPHDVPFDRSGRVVVVPDKGFDRVFVFKLDPAAGKLVPGDLPWVTARPGAAPRHADFHPTGPYCYVNNELDSTVTTYRFDGERGGLAPLQTISTVPPDFKAKNTTAEIAVAPSGRFVYVSNRGHDSIAIFGNVPLRREPEQRHDRRLPRRSRHRLAHTHRAGHLRRQPFEHRVQIARLTRSDACASDYNQPVAGDPESKAQRRAARATWPIACFALGDESADDISEVTTPAERIAMMWQLAETAWKLAGRPLPTYDRRHMPSRLFLPGTRPPDDDA